LAAREQDDVEQGFGDRIRAAPPAGDDAHRPVAVPGEAGLAERFGEGYRTNSHDSILSVTRRRVKCGRAVLA
jgi:hypothetical protein